MSAGLAELEISVLRIDDLGGSIHVLIALCLECGRKLGLERFSSVDVRSICRTCTSKIRVGIACDRIADRGGIGSIVTVDHALEPAEIILEKHLGLGDLDVVQIVAVIAADLEVGRTG